MPDQAVPGASGRKPVDRPSAIVKQNDPKRKWKNTTLLHTGVDTTFRGSGQDSAGSGRSPEMVGRGTGPWGPNGSTPGSSAPPEPGLPSTPIPGSAQGGPQGRPPRPPRGRASSINPRGGSPRRVSSQRSLSNLSGTASPTITEAPSAVDSSPLGPDPHLGPSRWLEGPSTAPAPAPNPVVTMQAVDNRRWGGPCTGEAKAPQHAQALDLHVSAGDAQQDKDLDAAGAVSVPLEVEGGTWGTYPELGAASSRASTPQGAFQRIFQNPPVNRNRLISDGRPPLPPGIPRLPIATGRPKVPRLPIAGKYYMRLLYPPPSSLAGSASGLADHSNCATDSQLFLAPKKYKVNLPSIQEFVQQLRRCAAAGAMGGWENADIPLKQMLAGNVRVREVLAPDGDVARAFRFEEGARRSSRPSKPVSLFTPSHADERLKGSGTGKRKGRDLPIDPSLRKKAAASSDEEEGAEEGELLVGEDYQAVIPPVRPRPKSMTPSEAVWCSAPPVLAAGDLGTPRGTLGLVPLCSARPDRQPPMHYRIVNGRPLTAQEEEALGLDRLGVNCRRGWLEAEEREFAKGMQRCVHDSLEFICEKVLPKKGMLKLAEYYYNVWKTRSTVDAIRFYCLAERIRKPWKYDEDPEPSKEPERKPSKPRQQSTKPAGAAKPAANQQQRRQGQGQGQSQKTATVSQGQSQKTATVSQWQGQWQGQGQSQKTATASQWQGQWQGQGQFQKTATVSQWQGAAVPLGVDQASALPYVTITPTVERVGAVPLQPFADAHSYLPSAPQREAGAEQAPEASVAPVMHLRRSPRPGSVPPDRRIPTALCGSAVRPLHMASGLAVAGAHPPPAGMPGPQSGHVPGAVMSQPHQATVAQLLPGTTWTIRGPSVEPCPQTLLAPAPPQRLPP